MLVSGSPSLAAKDGHGQTTPAVFPESGANLRKKSDGSLAFWCPRPSKVRRVSHFGASHKVSMGGDAKVS